MRPLVLDFWGLSGMSQTYAGESGMEGRDKKKATAIRDGGPNKGGDLLFVWVKCKFVGFFIFLPKHI